jgi:sugar phosphate isomerase/epimerase
MVRIAVFPKAYLEALSDRSMDLMTWIEEAGTLGADGLELYPAFLRRLDAGYLRTVARAAQDRGLAIPMMCASPDFTHPHRMFRRKQRDRMRRMIDVMAEVGPDDFRSCRVLSGQRHPEVDRRTGVRYAVECIQELLPYAGERRVHLVMENHYKDGFWTYPEFAQASDVFFEIADQIESPWFGINFDPSNAIVAGEDPIVLMDRALPRIRTMHASDRRLADGYTLEDLANHTGIGYSQGLVHGVIGRGLIDYDAVFARLRSIQFDGWISIEDGVNGMDEMRESVNFLRGKVEEYGLC